MVIGECVWDVCVYISCTGDEGQLGSSKTTCRWPVQAETCSCSLYSH